MNIGFLIAIINLLLINSKETRNLKLGITPENFKILSDIAKDTVHQIYIKTVDFSDGRNNQIIEDSNTLLLKVILSENQEIPSEEEKAYFDIINYSVKIPSSISFPKLDFDIFGANDLEEEFKAFAENIGNKVKNGKFYTYKKIGENAAQTHYRCFVDSDDGTKVGSFEIVQQDKNDEKTIIDKIAAWYTKIKEKSITVTNEVKAISELIATWKGIIKDIRSGSPFIKSPFFILLIILLLF